MQTCAAAGFMTGVSLMPLLPFITDVPEQLARMYAAFKQHSARYVFPASITLWGDDAVDSKQLVLQAVQQYYPQHLTNYQRLFAHNTSVPAAYNNALQAVAAIEATRHALPAQIPFE
jgi:DNA repair photolyase